MPELLDPPRHLRLVSSSPSLGATTGAAPARQRQSTELGGQARAIYRLVAEAAMAQGYPLDRNALRLVLAVRQSRHGGAMTKFTSTDVWQLLFVDILSWCRARRLSVPSGCGVALEYLIETLHDHGELHPDSDNVAALLLAIDECTGGWDIHDLGTGGTGNGRAGGSGRRNTAEAAQSLRSKRGSRLSQRKRQPSHRR